MLTHAKIACLIKTSATTLITIGEHTMTNRTIQAGQTLISRSVCDHNCIFELQVVDRKKDFVVIKFLGNTKRIKVRRNQDGVEYLRPENYSMAPIFKAA